MAFAPTNEAEERVMEEFYERMTCAFFLRMSQDKLGWERVMERQGIRSMDGNGKGLAECLRTE